MVVTPAKAAQAYRILSWPHDLHTSLSLPDLCMPSSLAVNLGGSLYSTFLTILNEDIDVTRRNIRIQFKFLLLAAIYLTYYYY
jgi:hypothetical protein